MAAAQKKNTYTAAEVAVLESTILTQQSQIRKCSITTHLASQKPAGLIYRACRLV